MADPPSHALGNLDDLENLELGGRTRMRRRHLERPAADQREPIARGHDHARRHRHLMRRTFVDLAARGTPDTPAERIDTARDGPAVSPCGRAATAAIRDDG